MKRFDCESEEVQLALIRKWGARPIRHITSPSLKVQLAAVKHNGFAIKFIKNPSHEVKLAAVKQDPRALQCIEV